MQYGHQPELSRSAPGRAARRAVLYLDPLGARAPHLWCIGSGSCSWLPAVPMPLAYAHIMVDRSPTGYQVMYLTSRILSRRYLRYTICLQLRHMAVAQLHDSKHSDSKQSWAQSCHMYLWYWTHHSWPLDHLHPLICKRGPFWIALHLQARQIAW